jgi:hypothetical protein
MDIPANRRAKRSISFGRNTKRAKKRPANKAPPTPQDKEHDNMETTEVEKKKRTRPSKGKRIHNRRVKQEARKSNMTKAELKKRVN